jgi:hypothetical protein
MRRRRYSTVAAVLASLALVAALPAPCHCLPMPAAAAEHTCCQPPSGYRVVEQGCCPAAGLTQECQLPAPPPAATPALAVVVSLALPAVPAAERSLASPAPAPSPPPTVRRL